MTGDLKEQMQQVLDRLNIPLRIAYLPNESRKVHGEIVKDSSTIFIFDKEESEAWATFTHEVLEYKFRDVSRGYRLVINGLIEAIEKMCYERKENFLEFLPRLVEATEEAKT